MVKFTLYSTHSSWRCIIKTANSRRNTWLPGPLILLVLDSGSRRERDAALSTLLSLRDPRSRDRIAAYRETELDEDLREKAATVLEALRSPR